MADDDVYKDFDPRGMGAVNQATDAPAPDRGLLGWGRDTAIDVTRGGLGLIRSATGIASGAATGVEPRGPAAQQTRENLTALEDIDWFLKRGKTEKGQQYERESTGFAEAPVNYATKTAAGVLPYLPLAMLGPVGGAAAGGLAGYGTAVSDVHERIRDAPEEELLKSPDYKRYRGTGMSVKDAREQLTIDSTDPTKLQNLTAALPNVLGQIAGGGLGGVVLSKAGQRTIAEAITERILRNTNYTRPFYQRAGVGMAGGAVGGAAGMGGADITRQMQDVNLGLKEGVNWGEAAGAAGAGAATFGVVGGVLHSGKRRAPPIGTDVESVARMQQQGYGQPGPVRPIARGGEREMQQGDVTGEYGFEGPGAPPPPPGRPMLPSDIAPERGEYGEEVAPSGVPVRPGRAMRPGEIAYPEGGAPREATPYDVGMAPMPQRGPYVPPRRGRAMVPEDIAPSEYGPVTEPAGGRRRRAGREMTGYDLEQPREYAYPEVTRPGEEAGYPPSGRAGQEPPAFTVPEPGAPRPAGYDPTQRGGGLPPEAPRPPPGPRPPTPEEVATEGGRRPAFPEMERPGRPGVPRAEEELPYADRAPLRAALQGKNPQTRGVWADQLEKALNRGERPTLTQPMRFVLGKNADRIERLLQTSPRGVIAEMRRGLEPTVAVERLGADHVSALRAVGERTSPEQVSALDNVIAGGAKSIPWNRLPMRDVLGDHRAAVVDAFRKNPREAADILAGRTHEPEAARYRETEVRPEPETQAREEPHGEEVQPRRSAREATEEDIGIEKPRSEYGEEVEPSREVPFIRPSERRRVGRAARPGDIGLTPRGAYAPGVRARMGETLRLGGGETRLQAIMRRAEERRRERTRQMANVTEAAESVRQQRALRPEEGVEHIEPSVERNKARIEAEQQDRARLAAQNADTRAMARFRQSLNEIITNMQEFRGRVGVAFNRAMSRIPVVREMARLEANEQRRLDRDAKRKRQSRAGDFEYRERIVSRVLTDESTEFVAGLEAMTTPSKAKGYWLSPSGMRYAQTAEQIARGGERMVDAALTIPLDTLSQARLFEFGQHMVDMAKLRIASAKAVLEEAAIQRTRPGQKPRIGWGLPTVRSGQHQWYDRLADLNRMTSALQRQINSSQTERARSTMVNLYVREKMLKEGRIAEWEQYNREQENVTYNDIMRRRSGYANELATRESPGSKGFDPARETYLRNRMTELDHMIEVLQESTTEKPFDHDEFIDALSDRNEAFARQLDQDQRRLALDWVRERLSGPTEEQRIQAARTQLVTQQREAPPRPPTRGETTARITALEQRAEQIIAAVDAVPQDRTGRVRETADTWRSRIQEPDQPVPERMKQPTNEKIDAEIQKAHTELEEIERGLRDLYETTVPGAAANEYGLRGVLDGASDLTKHRNLPKGASVKRVSDYLAHGVGGVERLRPGPTVPGANLINHYLNVVDTVAGDVHVVALTDEQMQLAARTRSLPPDTPAFYDVKSHRILISKEHLFGPNRNRILMHEFGHPMIEAAIQRFPDIGKRLDDMRRIVQREWLNNNAEVSAALGYDTQGLTNVHEFLTELYSDGGKLASALHAIRTTEAERAGFRTARGENLLQSTLQAIKRGLTNLFFSVSKKRLLNDATIASLELFQSIERQGRARPTSRGEAIARPITLTEEWMKKTAADTASRANDMLGDVGGTRALIYLSNLSDLEHRAERGMQERTSAVSQAMDRRNATANRLAREKGTEDIAYRIARLQRTNTKAYERLQEYVDLSNHYQLSGKDPLYSGSNKHVSRDAPEHEQQRAMHAELQTKWNALTQPEKQLHDDMREHYDKRHTEMLEANLDRLIEYKGLVPGNDAATKQALMEHIISGKESPLLDSIPGFKPGADHQWFLNQVAQVREGGQFRKLPVFFPSMRRGQHVVEAKFNLKKHAEGGIERGTDTGEFDFATKEQADAFRRSVANDPKLKGVRLQDVGEAVYAKDEHGNVMLDTEGDPVPLTEYKETTRTRGEELEPGYREEVTSGVARRVRPKDAGDDGIVRHRVKYNPLLLEFFEKQHEANARIAELKPSHDAGTLKLSHLQPVRDPKGEYLNPQQSDKAHRAMMRGLHNSPGWRNVDTTTRAMLERDIKEQQIRHTMSASARAMYLPRQHALGARKDLLRNFLDYTKNTDLSLADLRHREEISNAMEQTEKYVEGMKWHGSPGDPQGQFGVVRQEVLRSLQDRVMDRPNAITNPVWSKVLTNVLRLSYIKQLASPMFTALQMSEPWLIHAPAGAARFGPGFYGTLTKALGDVGYLRAGLGQGLRDAGRTLAAGPFSQLQHSNLLATLKDNVRSDPAAVKLLDYMEAHSLIERDTGMELATQYDPAASWRGKALDWADHMVRQVNSQVEGANRAGFGLALYRDAMASGKYTEAQAYELVRQSVHKLGGNYNRYASAPIFNNKYLGPALQFRRYSGRMTSQWIRTAVDSFSKLSENLSEEERGIARKQLAYMVGTVIATSGVLGLPTEPIKAVVNLSSPLTGFNSDDAERWVRERGADLAGPELGMALTRGVPRLLNLGFGTRVGMDTMWTRGGLPRNPNDWYTSLGHAFGGAPLTMAIEGVQGGSKVVSGMGHLINGRETEGKQNLSEGLEMLLPFKLLADTAQAGRNAAGGTMARTRTGQPQGFEQSAAETAMNIFGVRSGRQQEAQEKRTAMRTDMRKADEQKKHILTAYAYADSSSERAVIQRQIRDYNEAWPELKALTIADLIKARRRHEARETQDPSALGVALTRRQKALLPRYGAYGTLE